MRIHHRRTLHLLWGLLPLAACHPKRLESVSASLLFSSPDQAADVSQLSGSEVNIDFGAVGEQTTRTLTLTLLSNQADVTVGIEALTAVQPDPEFVLPLVPQTVGPVGAQTQVSFTPTSLGPKAAVFSLVTNSSTAGIVTLRLTGLGVPQGLVAVPNPVQFGNIEVNQSGVQALTITNNGAITARLVLSSPTGAGASLFNVGPPTSSSLSPGATTSAQVQFAPTLTGAAKAQLTVTGCDGCAPTVIGLVGTGVTSLLQTAPNPLHFGFVTPGTSVSQSVTITNIGQHAVALSAPGPVVASTSQASPFYAAATAVAYPLTLQPGDKIEQTVSFAPATLGFYASSLSFGTDDMGAPTVVVPIDGYGGGPQIACIPAGVDFGLVPLGQPATSAVTCTNVGSDVPDHPEAALQLAFDGGLLLDNPLFSATYPSLPVDEAGDGGVALRSGQSIGLQVSYLPTVEEGDRGILTISSNAANQPLLQIELTGRGLVPGICNYAVEPSQGLQFGEIPPGSNGQQQASITNVGTGYCVVRQIGLQPGTDPSFSLLQAPPYAVLDFPGDTVNDGGFLTSLRILAQFAPLTTDPQARGALQAQVSNAPPGPQQVSVALSGSGANGCLQITPPTLDFGLVGFNLPAARGCVSEELSFTAVNTCAMPVTVSSIDVNSGLDASAQFGLGPVPNLPLVLASGGQLALASSFDPTSLGPKAGRIDITTSEFSTPYQVTLLGNAEAAGQRSETFTAQQNKVDFAFILDNDDDQQQLKTVSDQLGGLIEAATEAHLDYQFAVTSTDVATSCDGGSDQGYFEPCDHCKSTTSPNPFYVTSQLGNPAQLLADLFVLFPGDGNASACNNGDEHFIEAVQDTFDPQLLATHNSAFIRPGAYLAVLLINGDPEDDKYPDKSVSATIQKLQSLKPDPSLVSFSYINDGASALNTAPRMQQLVQGTGGVELDTQTNWTPGFLHLFESTERLGQFQLKTSADPSSIGIAENGVPTAATDQGQLAWSYDPATTTVTFQSGFLPAPGTVVTINYSVRCQ